MRMNNQKSNKYFLMIEDMREKKKKIFYRKVKLGVLIFSLVVAMLFVCMSTVSMGKDKSDFNYVTVQTGDTLWSIADEVSEGKDVREMVYEIKQLNNCAEYLQPGDILKIPN